MIFEDPSFEASSTETPWTFIGTTYSTAITGTVDSVSPKDGSKMLKLAASSSETGVSQDIFVSQYSEIAPHIVFYYRKTATTSAHLDVYVGTTKVSTISKTAAVSSWTAVNINLLDYSSEEGIKHTIKFVVSGGGSGTFYLDLAEIKYTPCTDSCVFGVCYTTDSGSTACHCDDNHEGAQCDTPLCGDGIVMYPEECDDGNKVSGDGCSSTCKVESGWTCPESGGACTDNCGDGRTMSSAPDACDDGNTVDGDGCSHDCKWEKYFKCTQSKTSRSVCTIWCGDGLVYPPEVCDVAAGGVGPGGCKDDCAEVNDGWECTSYQGSQNSCYRHVCGDGARTSDEECDDGNTRPGDGCDANCHIEEGFIISIGSRGKLEKSIMQPICGDGRTVFGEECDSGSTLTYRQTCIDCKAVSGFHCEVNNFVSVCKPRCGDGVRTEYDENQQLAPEECDDGNTDSGDGCSSDCKLEVGFVCTNNTFGNKTKCVKAVCGNGILESGETCDLGTVTHPGCVGCQEVLGYTCSNVTNTCTEKCGDGYITQSESCDAGDLAGCTANCQGARSGFDCHVETGTKNGQTYRYSVCESSCGDGSKSDEEECDDGNNKNGDGCDGYCFVEHPGWSCTTVNGQLSVCTSTCGDGHRVGTEECDDGNTVNGDGCSSTCTVETGFECPSRGGACYPICGDGRVLGDEQCDDGNILNGDGCDSLCKVESGWQCRKRASDGVSECMKPGCGNGQVSWEEDCDDGNTIDGDGCSSTCHLEDPTNKTTFECYPDPKNWTTVCKEIKCGNGIVTTNEECDDGNTKDGDGCNSTCYLERGFGFDCTRGEPTVCRLVVGRCGTGYRDYLEGCDDGNTRNGDGCSDNCTVEDDYYCEDRLGAGLTRWSVCRKIVCGDGITDVGEQCDDGNNEDGDGCSSKCVAELGYNCIVRDFRSRCTAGCGNGKKADDEECDDGNFINGDGCSSRCAIEHGFTCTKDPVCIRNCGTVCYSTCGDGIVSSDEECDDGNQYSGDGCSPDCRVETSDVGLWMCVGEPSQCTRRECGIDLEILNVGEVGCGGAATGSIEINVTTIKNGDWVARARRDGDKEEVEYEVTTVFKNLLAGKYYVEVHMDGFEKCNTKKEVEVKSPAALKTNKAHTDAAFWAMLGNKAPSCDGSDGKFTWPVTGGTDPKQYTFGPFNNTDGKFTGLSMSVFYNYRPRVTDAHGCVLDLEDYFYDKFPDPDTTCQKGAVDQFLADLWGTGGPEGVIIIAATFLVVIILGIGYCCWSNDKQVPRNAQRPPQKK